MDLKSKIILISGPTASGKSNFAMRLAKEIKGEITIIINGASKPEVNSFDEVNLRKELHLLVKALLIYYPVI